MPFSECNATLLEFNKGRKLRFLRNGISEGQYCAYDSDGHGRDSCEGDSGAPLQRFPPDSETATVVGIVSFGISCGSLYPSVHTRVASYVDWIESIVWPNGEVQAGLWDDWNW